MAGILSKGITLAYKADGGSFVDLTNLQEIPEMGSNARSREKIDVTTLADDEKKSIDGLMEEAETQELTFKFLYEKAQFTTLAAIDEDIEWKVTLPDSLTATFTGRPAIKLDGAGVSAAVTYTLSISVASDIAFA